MKPTSDEIKNFQKLANSLKSKKVYSSYEFPLLLDDKAYITEMTALRHYDLIPEAVSVNKVYSSKDDLFLKLDIGVYVISKVPDYLLGFGVEDVVLDNVKYRIATPLKAILDHALQSKKMWEIEIICLVILD